MSGLYEIWKDDEGRLSEEKLKAYLEGTLSADEAHEIERLLSEETMESDALEGLQQIHAAGRVASVHQLNEQLHQLTHKRKRRTTTFGDNKWIWLAIVVILLLCVLGYWVLFVMSK